MLLTRCAILVFLIHLFCADFNSKAQIKHVSGNFKERKEIAVADLKKYPGKDTARVNALIRIVTKATFLKEQKEVLPYKQEALLLSRKLNYNYGLAECYFATSNYLKSSSDYANALNYYDSTLYFIGNSTELRFRQLRTLVSERKGLVYYAQENYYPAIKCFFEVLKDEGNRINPRVIRVNILITDSYKYLNNLDKAAEYAAKNIAIFEKDTSFGSMAASAYLTCLDISIAKNDLHSAALYLEKLKPFAEDPAETLISFGYFMKKGHISYKLGKYPEAFSEYQQAYKFATAGNHKGSISSVLSELSRTASQLGKYKEAEEFASKNLALADEMTTTAPKVEALMNMASYHHATGNDREAFELEEKAMQLKDTLIAEMNLKQVNLLGAMYERETQQKQIENLQILKQKQEAAVKQTSLLNKVFLALIGVLLIAGYLGFLNFKKGQQLAKSEQELQRQKISELEKDKRLVGITAMMKGQEEERSRIAKDLHDGFGGLLAGTKLSFINVKDKLLLSAEDHVLFEKSLSMLDNTIGDLRKVAHNLMPEALVKFGLQDAIGDFCEYIESVTGLRVLYQQLGEQRKLDSTAEIFIYRMVQELLNNVVKHAQATQVIVQFAMSAQKVSITVEDDGKGFDKDSLSTSKGAGMANINYRAECLNGRTDIVTSPGEGTSVNIELVV